MERISIHAWYVHEVAAKQRRIGAVVSVDNEEVLVTGQILPWDAPPAEPEQALRSLLSGLEALLDRGRAGTAAEQRPGSSRGAPSIPPWLEHD